MRGAPGAMMDQDNLAARVNNDLFGGGDVVVKYVRRFLFIYVGWFV